jgi:hypothetical protein
MFIGAVSDQTECEIKLLPTVNSPCVLSPLSHAVHLGDQCRAIRSARPSVSFSLCIAYPAERATYPLASRFKSTAWPSAK